MATGRKASDSDPTTGERTSTCTLTFDDGAVTSTSTDDFFGRKLDHETVLTDDNDAFVGKALTQYSYADTATVATEAVAALTSGVYTSDAANASPVSSAVRSYTYDAWGNFQTNTPSTLTSAQFAEAALVVTHNPVTYRGYYYLQSRCYNPEWGRFLNADDAEYISYEMDLDSVNIFIYCQNNPANRIDPMGHASWVVDNTRIGCSKTVTITTSFNNKYTVKYDFETNGVAVINNQTQPIWTIIWRQLSDELAEAILTNSLKSKSNSMSGRTKKGIQLEIAVHYYAYKLGILVVHSNPTEIGGTNVDKNAKYFEMRKYLKYLTPLLSVPTPTAAMAIIILFQGFI